MELDALDSGILQTDQFPTDVGVVRMHAAKGNDALGLQGQQLLYDGIVQMLYFIRIGHGRLSYTAGDMVCISIIMENSYYLSLYFEFCRLVCRCRQSDIRYQITCWFP